MKKFSVLLLFMTFTSYVQAQSEQTQIDIDIAKISKLAKQDIVGLLVPIAIDVEKANNVEEKYNMLIKNSMIYSQLRSDYLINRHSLNKCLESLNKNPKEFESFLKNPYMPNANVDIDEKIYNYGIAVHAFTALNEMVKSEVENCKKEKIVLQSYQVSESCTANTAITDGSVRENKHVMEETVSIKENGNEGREN